MGFTITPLRLEGVCLVESSRHGDDRGWFVETWKASAFREAGLPADFRQDNLARSERGVIRGLHYQAAPHAQAKLVRVILGRILDVTVDLRLDSPTFGEWLSVELDDQTGAALLVPEGFAHGYQVLSDQAVVAYKAGAEYAPAAERTVLWHDPELCIDWRDLPALVSAKDQVAPTLSAISSSDLF